MPKGIYKRKTTNHINDECRSKKWLYQKYIVEKLSSQKIADLLGRIDRKTIDQWLTKVQIKKRGIGGSRGKKTKKWLIKQYIGKEKSLSEIAMFVGEDHKTIHRWLIYYGIPRRSQTRKQVSTGKRTHKHKRIVERHIGRKLSKKEVIHHINFKRNDNRIENLYLFISQGEHSKYHHKYENNLIGLLKSNIFNE